jgi:hypothetical protein
MSLLGALQRLLIPLDFTQVARPAAISLQPTELSPETLSQSKSAILRLTVSHGVKPTLRLVTRYYFLSEGCCLVSVGCPL